MACFGVIYMTSAVALGVFRTHAISISAELQKNYNLPETNRAAIERLVSSTGDAPGYFRMICSISVLFLCLNTALLGWFYFTRKRTAIEN